LGTLGTHGMTVVNPLDERFDPNIHEATFEMPFPGKEPGTVFHVEQKGYLLNGRVLRPAKVCVLFLIEWVLTVRLELYEKYNIFDLAYVSK
jgi:molecular chaperone GrpE (heat shock protein)